MLHLGYVLFLIEICNLESERFGRSIEMLALVDAKQIS